MVQEAHAINLIGMTLFFQTYRSSPVETESHMTSEDEFGTGHLGRKVSFLSASCCSKLTVIAFGQYESILEKYATQLERCVASLTERQKPIDALTLFRWFSWDVSNSL